MSKLTKINDRTHIIKGDDTMLGIDMTQMGFKKERILATTTETEWNKLLLSFSIMPQEEIRVIFNSCLRELVKTYNTNMEWFYEDEKRQSDFISDCLIYCVCMKMLYNREIPIKELTELNIDGLIVNKI